MIQEKIKSESMADHELLRREDPEGAGKPVADSSEVKALTGVFGNSTQQDKFSSLAQTARPGRFKDVLK